MNALSINRSDEKPNNVKTCAVNFIALCVFSVGFSGTVASTAGLSPLFMLISGVVFSALFAFLQNLKKGKPIILCVFLIITGSALTVFFRITVDGIKYILNSVFTLSEKAQPYKYNFFKISGGADRGAQIALCLFIIGICALLAVLPSKIRTVAAFILSGGLIVSSIYFGVFFSPAFFILLTVGVILISVTDFKKDGLFAAVPIIVSTVLLLSLFSMAPPVKSVSDTGNSLRDKFAVRTVYVEGVTVETHKKEQETKEKENEARNEDNKERERKLPDYKIIVSILIFAIISALLLFVSKRLETLNLRRDKNKNGIDSPDNSKAVCAMFRYTLMLLKADGVETGYKLSEIETPFNEEYKSDFRHMLSIFNEAAFSNNEITDTQRDEMFSFMNTTKELILMKSNLKEKLEIKYRYAL